jgi:hypothetical protein
LNRYCGQRLNPDAANSGQNADIVCMSNIWLLQYLNIHSFSFSLAYMKPFMLLVHSDSRPQVDNLQSTPKDQKGFQLRYQQISC